MTDNGNNSRALNRIASVFERSLIMYFAMMIGSSIILVHPVKAYSAGPVLSDLLVTDVTDRSFSLIWTSDQPGQEIVEVYNDSGGTQLVNGFNVSEYSVFTGSPASDGTNRQQSIDSIAQAAKALGIYQALVTGLDPNTNYYIKFGIQSDATGDITLCPDVGAVLCPDAHAGLIPVVTQSQPNRISSAPDVFLNDYLLSLNLSAKKGELVVISMETSNYPVSAYVGDGVPEPYALIEMNNLFSSMDQQTLPINGSLEQSYGNTGEAFIVRLYKGLQGSDIDVMMAGAQLGTGATQAPIDKSYGDCNGDGQINGYDDLLLSKVIAEGLTSNDYSTVAFHPVLCNLYKESGIYSVATDVVIDAEDKIRLEELLIGQKSIASFPEVP
jgi:hypothetical protein